MIELTEDLVYRALKLAKNDQDKIIKKAKEIEDGPKTSRAGNLADERADETV
jgi:hypothetical protein